MFLYDVSIAIRKGCSCFITARLLKSLGSFLLFSAQEYEFQICLTALVDHFDGNDISLGRQEDNALW